MCVYRTSKFSEVCLDWLISVSFGSTLKKKNAQNFPSFYKFIHIHFPIFRTDISYIFSFSYDSKIILLWRAYKNICTPFLFFRTHLL